MGFECVGDLGGQVTRHTTVAHAVALLLPVVAAGSERVSVGCVPVGLRVVVIVVVVIVTHRGLSYKLNLCQ